MKENDVEIGAQYNRKEKGEKPRPIRVLSKHSGQAMCRFEDSRTYETGYVPYDEIVKKEEQK